MESVTVGYDDYQALRSRAVAPDATQEDINLLGQWFDRFGIMFWNGEYYDADDDHRLFPVYQWDEDTDTGEVIGYEFR